MNIFIYIILTFSMKRSANKPNRFNNNGMSYLAELNQGNYIIMHNYTHTSWCNIILIINS